jgi:hypothetical protein
MPQNRPSITPAQIVAVLIAGVPAIANLLAAFSVYTLNVAQQSALTEALTWAGAVAAVLIVSDAGLRSARNAADAPTEAAQATSVPTGPGAVMLRADGPHVGTYYGDRLGQPQDPSAEVPGGGPEPTDERPSIGKVGYP